MDQLLDNYSTRWMTAKDISACSDIDYESSRRSHSKKELADLLHDNRTVGMVMVVRDKIAAFMLLRNYRAYIELFHIAVDSRLLRKGLGTILVGELKSRLNMPGRDSLICYVRETDLDFQLFLKALNFRAIKIEKRHFTDPVEDGYMFKYKEVN